MTSNFSSPSGRRDFFEEALFKNLAVVLFGLVINYINGTLLYTFFTNVTFHSDARYILYMQLIINDSIKMSFIVLLLVMSYVCPFLNVSVCIILILIGSNTHKNAPLNLAIMSIERFVAICHPLQHPLICTVSRTYALIACIWVVGAFPGFIDVIIAFVLKPLSFFTTGRMCYHQNVFDSVHNYNNNYAANILYMCFVWITLIYTYFRVMLSAKAATSDPVSARKAQITILLHGVQLLLCMLSYVTPVMDTTLIILFPNFRSIILFCNNIITNMLPQLLSPLIYGLRDQKFKKHMKGSLLCMKTNPVVKPN
ncbi:odorant receptor 131-2-like [Oncorhynchus nerka]|uniref:odorant receptor 131-2-like n=1 Tax=Oncorhynchus nerka TaxID=8023 RepID=UPI001130217E|nr:odorant receptor 131-2-like [Oncorhynchus nerka]